MLAQDITKKLENSICKQSFMKSLTEKTPRDGEVFSSYLMRAAYR